MIGLSITTTKSQSQLLPVGIGELMQPAMLPTASCWLAGSWGGSCCTQSQCDNYRVTILSLTTTKPVKIFELIQPASLPILRCWPDIAWGMHAAKSPFAASGYCHSPAKKKRKDI